MDDQDAGGKEITSRPPTLTDLKKVCEHLNKIGAKYILIGGLALNYFGYTRATTDIDLLVDSSEENINKVSLALSFLQDKASLQVRPDDINEYSVVRIADEVVIDLIGKVGDVTYQNSEFEIWIADGVKIPIGTVETLIRTKQGIREKDKTDLNFLLMIKRK
jgi:hypothetical protein